VKTLQRPQRDERGAILIVAMVFITVVFLMLNALMEQGATNLRSTSNLQQVLDMQYAADGAVQQAIAELTNTAVVVPNACPLPGGASGCWPLPVTNPPTETPCALLGTPALLAASNITWPLMMDAPPQNPNALDPLGMVADCTDLGATVTSPLAGVHYVEITACPSTAANPEGGACNAAALLRSYVEFSQSVANPFEASIIDWSVLYGVNT
jgi:hypothetical protein